MTYEAENLTFCEICNRELSDQELVDHEDECQPCWDTMHFTCARCGEEFEADDESEDLRDHCEACFDELEQEAFDRDAETLRDSIEEAIDTDDVELLHTVQSLVAGALAERQARIDQARKRR